MTSLGHPEHF
jgi:hypothetical protein